MIPAVIVLSLSLFIASIKGEPISYVLDSYDEKVQVAVNASDKPLAFGNTASSPYIGEGFLRLSENSTSSVVSLLDFNARQAHNCEGADRISLWYRTNSNDVTIQLGLYDSSQCDGLVHEDCLQLHMSSSVALQPVLSQTNQSVVDWTEVSWAFHDDRDWLDSVTKMNLMYIHGYEIFLSDFDDTMDLDHLACYGGPELFQSHFKVTVPIMPIYPDMLYNWQFVTHESELAKNETIATIDGSGCLSVNYTAEKTATWGGFTSFAAFFPGYYNLTAANALAFDYKIHSPANPPGLLAFRLVVDEEFSPNKADLLGNERFYSFHYILDADVDNNETMSIILPLEGGPNSNATFWYTGWSGGVNDRVLDKSRIKSFTWEVAMDSWSPDGIVVSGSIDIINFRLEMNETMSSADRMCENESAVTLTGEGWNQLKFRIGVGSCCRECEKTENCKFAIQSARKNCALAPEISPSLGQELRLNNGGALDMTSDYSFVSWMSGINVDFCEICDCVEGDLHIDCQGKNLSSLPQRFSKLWDPKSLDLRDNPNLAIIGRKALQSISAALEQILFPANLRYLAFSAIEQSPMLKSVDFEAFNILNMRDGDGTFGDVCCVEGAAVVADRSDGNSRRLGFCDHQGANSVGTDTLFLPNRQFRDSYEIAHLRMSSPFMAQAAETPEMCAEYCKLNSRCLFFEHDSRTTQSESSCLHYSRAWHLIETREFADEKLQTPGVVSGVAPRARGMFDDARVFLSQSELRADKENEYTVSYEVKLGAMPQRGVVWIEPYFISSDGLSVTLSPTRVSLSDNMTVATVTASIVDVGAVGNKERTVILMNNITTCDQAFSSDFLDSSDQLIHIAVAPHDEFLRGVPIELVVSMVLLLVAITILFWRMAGMRVEEEQSWKVEVKELKFPEHSTVLGRGTFGLVVLAEWRGTDVAVKRVIPSDNHWDHKLNDSCAGGSSSCLLSPTVGSSTRSGHQSLKAFKRSDVAKLRSNFIREMRLLSTLRHPNITTVMGAVVQGPDPLLVMEFMDHGSLYDIIHNESMPLEGDLILQVLRDIASGMRFLHVHKTPIVHGDLKAANCLVDSHFRAKVTDFGLSAKKTLGVTGTPYWMDPKLLMGEAHNTPETDVYSFGIMLYELYSRSEPYDQEDFETVLKEICDPKINKRPPIPLNTPPTIAQLMKECHSSNHEDRPTFGELDKRLRRIDAEQVEPGESMFFSKQKKSARNEELLQKMLPKHVVDALRDGRTVEPDRRDLVTVFFSDIVGFTSLSSQLSAHKVTDMLDRFYTKLDALADKHDVFKIDVIGDAYMCATNLVKDQPNDHVRRIAEFAMDAISEASATLVDEDDPELGFIRIRCGFHSGPVVAQVVGRSSLKYSVFGDAVNTASRMESNSLAGYIQCSARSAELLRAQAPNIHIELRGTITIKGKGKMETSFVNPPLNPTDAVLSKATSERQFAMPTKKSKSLLDVMAKLQSSFSSFN